MGGEDGDSARSAPPRRRLGLRVAVPVAIAGVAVGAVFLESLVAGRPQHPVARLVYCYSIISTQQPGADPTQITGGRKVRLPGGGGFACGQLVEPGGSEPVAVDLWTGTAGLSATMPRVPVMNLDLTENHKITPMDFRPAHEYLLMLESDPLQAHMFIYSSNRRSMLLSLHLVFAPPPSRSASSVNVPF